ncbi:MAG: hypothetical protein V3R73_06630 [Sphingomonadales bacterium]
MLASDPKHAGPFAYFEPGPAYSLSQGGVGSTTSHCRSSANSASRKINTAEPKAIPCHLLRLGSHVPSGQSIGDL